MSVALAEQRQIGSSRRRKERMCSTLFFPPTSQLDRTSQRTNNIRGQNKRHSSPKDGARSKRRPSSVSAQLSLNGASGPVGRARDGTETRQQQNLPSLFNNSPRETKSRSERNTGENFVDYLYVPPRSLSTTNANANTNTTVGGSCRQPANNLNK